MAKRQKMSRSSSKKLFSKTAKSVHKKNAQGGSYTMRGGIRL